MKAHQKKLSGCASNLLAHEDLGHLRKPIVGIYKPSSIMKKIPLVYESDIIGDSLYEEHGATLKHKCGKRIVALSLLFSFFWAFFYLAFPIFFFFYLAFPFFTWDNALLMMIITLLFIYNSMITTRY